MRRMTKWHGPVPCGVVIQGRRSIQPIPAHQMARNGSRSALRHRGTACMSSQSRWLIIIGVAVTTSMHKSSCIAACIAVYTVEISTRVVKAESAPSYFEIVAWYTTIIIRGS